MDDFWNRYENDIKEGYFRDISGRNCLKEEFIVEYPIGIVDRIKYDRRDRRTNRNRGKNKLSQIWKFYDYARRIQDNIRLQEVPLDALRADLQMLMPAASYALGRDTITSEFKRFIDLNVLRIEDKDDLAAFIKHFQSLIAYLPKENPK